MQKQILRIPNAYSGLVWSPNGAFFYVAGGQNDNVHVFARNGGAWAEADSPIALNHAQDGSGVGPVAAGLGITADGKTLVVANYENDSISLVDLAARKVKADLDLRPGKNDPSKTGVPGGEFPFWVAVKGNDTAYVSSERDREIVVVSIGGSSPVITGRIKVAGNPNKMVLNRQQTRLYVTADNEDALYVIDTNSGRILSSSNTTAPEEIFESRAPKGSNPNSVTLSPDEGTAYVTNSATNSVAVISLAENKPKVVGLIPTAWLPNSLSTSADGRTLYVANGKSPAGPNPNFCTDSTPDAARNTKCDLSQQYIFQDMKASLLTLPVPSGDSLEALTGQVAQNNGFRFAPSANDSNVMAFLHNHIQHVIYIIKENRTYDQILGDLGTGNGDPSLTEFGHAVTPNFHALASQFVNLDNFYCSGEVSMDGWQWSTSGRAMDTTEKTVPVNYGKGGASYDSEGDDRGVNVALGTVAERKILNPGMTSDPDYLPGPANEMAVDGPSGEQGAGYLWNNALRSGLSIRNYGVFADALPAASNYELEPFKTKTPVVVAADQALAKYTDPYFYKYDNHFPDYYRFREWAREFDGYVKHGNLPQLELVRLMHDHMGNFGSAVAGVNTPEKQQADNDYAVALLVEKVAKSPYASNTLIFVIEDDAQDGADHVDAHRSTAYVAGPYVKHGAVVSTRYATVNMIRTMEDVLGLPHQNLHDGGVPPMTNVFDVTQKEWAFDAEPSTFLADTQLPIGEQAKKLIQNGTFTLAALPKSTHDAMWWEERTKGMDFEHADNVDPIAFNRLLWQGLKGNMPYPTLRSGADLRHNREKLLKQARVETDSATLTKPHE
jgi:DNA-binding beta-propeller fold protein YncE